MDTDASAEPDTILEAGVRDHLASVIAWGSFFAASWLLFATRGRYHPWVVYYAGCVGLFLITVIGMRVCRRGLPLGPPAIVVISLGILMQLWLQFKNPGVMYFKHDLARQLLSNGILLSLAITAGAMLWGAWRRGGPLNLPLAPVVALFVIFLLGSGAVILGSPTPHIDVWTMGQEASELLWNGTNPYSHIYPDIYRGRYSYTPVFPYWPGTLYGNALSWRLTGEIRWEYVLTSILSLALLVRLSRSLLGPSRQFALPMVFMSLPMTFFVLEQSWVDAALISMVIASYVAFREQRFLLLGVLLVLAPAVKQYGVVFSVFLGLAVLRDTTWQQRKTLIFGATMTAGLLFIPFIILDAQAIYDSTVGNLLDVKPRMDSFSLTAHWAREGLINARGSGATLMTAVLGGLLCVWISWGRGDPLIATASLFAFFFLFSKVSFCNYHHFLLGIFALLLLHLHGNWLNCGSMSLSTSRGQS